MHETTTLWLIPLTCLLGSLLSTILILSAIVNTARLERHGKRPTPTPAHRPYDPDALAASTTTPASLPQLPINHASHANR